MVNSNPATIMTDEGIADRVYIEPLTMEVLERIIHIMIPSASIETAGTSTPGLNRSISMRLPADRIGTRTAWTEIEMASLVKASQERLEVGVGMTLPYWEIRQ